MDTRKYIHKGASNYPRLGTRRGFIANLCGCELMDYNINFFIDVLLLFS